MTNPSVELHFNPTDLRPRDLPKTAEFLGTPADAIEAALMAARLRMIEEMKTEVRGLAEPTHASLLRAADIAWQAVFWKYRKISAPVMADAYIHAYRAADAGDVPMSVIYDLADKHAEKIGDYFHDTSRDALAEGFSTLVNRRLPARAAADRVLDAYGLTPRQMRGYTSNKQLMVPVESTSPFDVKARARTYIDRSFTTRVRKLARQEEHNIEEQAKQFAWMWMQEKGRLGPRAQKLWITAKDERVCPVCGPLHGQKVGVNEQFKTHVGQFWTPGLHPNCRCVVRLIENRFSKVLIRKDDWDPEEHPRGGDPKNRGRFSRVAEQDQEPVIATPEPTIWESLALKEPEPKLEMKSTPESTLEMGGKLRMGQLSMGNKLQMGAAAEKLQMGDVAEKLQMGAAADSKKLSMTEDEVKQKLEMLTTPEMKLKMRQTFEQMTMTVPPYTKPKSRRRTVYDRPTIHIQDDSGHEYPVYAVVGPRQLNWGRGQVELDHNVEFTPDRGRAFGWAQEQFDEQMSNEVNRIWTDDLPSKMENGTKLTMNLGEDDVLAVVSWAAYQGRVADPDSQVDYNFDLEWTDQRGNIYPSEPVRMSSMAKALGVSSRDFDVRIMRMDEGHDSPDGTTVMNEAGSKAGYESWVTSGRYNATEIEETEVAHNLSIKMFWLDPDVKETEASFIGGE